MSNPVSRLISENEEINELTANRGINEFIFLFTFLCEIEIEIFGPKVNLRSLNSKTISLKENENSMKKASNAFPNQQKELLASLHPNQKPVKKFILNLKSKMKL